MSQKNKDYNGLAFELIKHPGDPDISKTYNTLDRKPAEKPINNHAGPVMTPETHPSPLADSIL